jgi:hypothetical protein
MVTLVTRSELSKKLGIDPRKIDKLFKPSAKLAFGSRGTVDLFDTTVLTALVVNSKLSNPNPAAGSELV